MDRQAQLAQKIDDLHPSEDLTRNLELFLSNFVAEIESIFEGDLEEAYQHDDYAQIRVLIHDINELYESSEGMGLKRIELISEKFRELYKLILEFKQKYSHSIRSSKETTKRFEDLINLLQDFDSQFKPSKESLKLVESIAKDAESLVELLVNKSLNLAYVIGLFSKFKKLLESNFNILKNESNVLWLIKGVSQAYIEAVSHLKPLKIDKNYTDNVSDLRSTCSEIISLIDTGNNTGLIALERDNQIIYISQNSAEGKAIQRIDDIDNAEEWITAVERDEEVDLDELDRRIRESGYLV